MPIDIFLQLLYNILYRKLKWVDMKTAVVKIWFEGDVGDASIEFTKTYNGDDCVAHSRFTKSAQKKFPSWSRIVVERM